MEDGAGERAAGGVVEGGDWREDLELGAVREGSGGAGPWVEGADAAFEGGGGEGPIEETVGAGELADVRGSGGVLRRVGGGAVEDGGESGEEGDGSEGGETVVERAAGFVRCQGEGFLMDDVPGVEACVHLHDGDT